MQWTVVDTERVVFGLVSAEGQCEAALKGLRRDGLVARRTDHVRPRTGEAELMTQEEYVEWFKECVEPLL